jgi:hypothetical protein
MNATALEHPAILQLEQGLVWLRSRPIAMRAEPLILAVAVYFSLFGYAMFW